MSHWFTCRLFTLAAAAWLGSPAAVAAPRDTLVWSDEFDGATVDPANWEFMIGNGDLYGIPGWGNNELEYYTSRPENVFVANGALHIVARREDYNGYQYTSARLRSRYRREFRYGRIEGRMILPSGQGIWPAFWMMPTDSPYGGWAACGEIDIMESINIADRVYGTIHFGGPWPGNTSTGGNFANGTLFNQGYHVYRLDWEPDEMRWYVDGQLYFTTNSSVWYSTADPNNPRAPFDTLFHFLINVAVGGNWPGPPNPSTPFPLELTVDWIRVYDFNPPLPGPYFGVPQPIPARIDAETFDTGGEGVAYHDCDATNNGGVMRPNEAVDIEACSEGTANVGWMCAGEWFTLTVDVQRAGRYDVETRVASLSSGGSFRFELGGADASGPIAAPPTGGWQSWTSVWKRFPLPGGVQTLRFANAGSGEFNVNCFRFYLAADMNRDFNVDLADGNLLFAALAGPEVGVPPPGCPPDQFARADLDGDADVDLGDFQVQQAAAGP